jgi:hypothetical protein
MLLQVTKTTTSFASSTPSSEFTLMARNALLDLGFPAAEAIALKAHSNKNYYSTN